MTVPLAIENLSLKFKNHVLFENVTFSVNSGEFVTLLGENGIGKTSLLNAVLNYKKMETGNIKFWGQELKKLEKPEIFNRVAYVSSTKELYPAYATLGHLTHFLRASYLNYDHALVESLIEGFKLNKNACLNELSLGESSKVRLLKALSFRPDLILFDELTANLSPESKKIILESLIGLLSEKKISILYVCHSKKEALKLSDKVLTLTKNGIIEGVY